jgi:phosphatidate cytidylyltransferase
MRNRLIVAAIGVPLTAVVVWFTSGLWFTLIVMAVALCCIYELCKNKFEWWLVPVSVMIALAFFVLARLRDTERGLELTIVIFACTYGSDAGAMLMGRYLGRHHPFPKISPNKTEMGLLGGLVAPVLIALIVDVLLQLSGYYARVVEFTLIGLVIGIASEMGDLFFSSIKRKLGIKDYGSILPGHGGLLDRFDSMVFAIPAALIIVVLLEELPIIA